MKRALLAFLILILPIVASAAPQQITIQYDSDTASWSVIDASPPLTLPNGAPVTQGSLVPVTKGVADALTKLQAVDGKRYRCKATAFQMIQTPVANWFGVSSFNARSCTTPCVPEPVATSCAATCGVVTNNCGDQIDCGTGFCPGTCEGTTCICNVTAVCANDCFLHPGSGIRQVLDPCSGALLDCPACSTGGGG